MMDESSKKNKYDKAFELYINSNLKIADICQLCNISVANFYRYKREDLARGFDWDELREEVQANKKEEIELNKETI